MVGNNSPKHGNVLVGALVGVLALGAVSGCKHPSPLAPPSSSDPFGPTPTPVAAAPELRAEYVHVPFADFDPRIEDLASSGSSLFDLALQSAATAYCRRYFNETSGTSSHVGAAVQEFGAEAVVLCFTTAAPTIPVGFDTLNNALGHVFAVGGAQFFIDDFAALSYAAAARRACTGIGFIGGLLADADGLHGVGALACLERGQELRLSRQEAADELGQTLATFDEVVEGPLARLNLNAALSRACRQRNLGVGAFEEEVSDREILGLCLP